MQLLVNLGQLFVSDEEREAIRPMVRKDDRLPSEQEVAEFIRQYGLSGINRAMGSEDA